MIYLDSAATTLHRPPSVQKAVRDAMLQAGGAGRSGHKASMKASEYIYDCREMAASFFNMSNPERVVFTLNCTHALNIAIKSFIIPQKRVIVSGFEHNAVMRPLVNLKRRGFIRLTVLNTPLFDPSEAVKLFKDALTSEVCLCVCTHVSNVYGYILPIEEINNICKSKNIPFIVDAAQSAGTLPIQGDSGPVWCMPGHKGLLGPQGTGLLLAPEAPVLSHILEGGTGSNSADDNMPDFLPDRLEAGTQNAHGIAGLKEGISYLSNLKNILAYERELLSTAANELATIAGVNVYASHEMRCQAGVLSVTIQNLDSESAADLLAEKNICVRGGIHCSPYAHKTGGTFPLGTIRISVSPFTTKHDIFEFIKAFKQILKDTATQ